ncbi:hypothetical protein Dimus_012478 [Dionaea muscipula]
MSAAGGVGAEGEMGCGGGGGGGDGILKKGPWSAAEDEILVDYVKKHGEGNWNAVHRNTSLLRCGKSCRLRWANHLRPNLKKGAFSSDEERLIIELHSKLGNKWARISSHLPGRTDNEVKNYWNTRVKRRLRLGLPLYPHGLKTCPTALSSPSPPPPPPLPPPAVAALSHLRTSPISLSLFDPLSISCPTPFFSTPPSSMVSAAPRRDHLLGGLQPQTAPIDPFEHNAIMSVDSFQLPSVHRIAQMEADASFEPKSELPSNQIFQKTIDEAMDEVNNAEYYAEDHVGGRGNSGLLDALLHEARTRGERRKMMKTETLGCEDAQWENSNSEASYTRQVKKEDEDDDDQFNTGNEDLSSILNNLIPSLVRAPEWCSTTTDSGEASAGKSSVVVTPDDNNISLGIPNFSSFPVVVGDTEEDDRNNNGSYYSWDNLPRIC